MLHVWPSIVQPQRRIRLHRRDRVIEHLERVRPQREAVEVEVHVLERELAARRAHDLNRRRLSLRRAALAVAHRDGEGHRARPGSAPSTASAGRSGCAACRRPPSTGRSADRRPDPARRPDTGRRAADFDRARIARRRVTVGGRFWRGAGGGGWWRRRRWRRRRWRRRAGRQVRVGARPGGSRSRTCRPLPSFGVVVDTSARAGDAALRRGPFMSMFQLAAPPMKNPFGACQVRPSAPTTGLLHVRGRVGTDRAVVADQAGRRRDGVVEVASRRRARP